VSPESQAVLRILIGALGGAAVGVERERSGHASGPQAHFAGVRTFTLLGGLAGTVGWLWTANLQLPALVLLAGGAALVVAAYVAASRNNIDGTTEVAALIVLTAGVLAGTGHLGLASGVIAVTAVLLVEKSRLHAVVASIDDTGLRAGLRFAVMAVVVLPLLPEGPYGPLGGVRPRQLWTLVLFFSGLSFAGYIVRHVAGSRRGYPIAGIIGGLISSTNVAFTFARLSRNEAGAAVPLAVGVIGACAVMYVRALLATAVLNPVVAPVLAPYLAAPFLVSALVFLIGLRKHVEGNVVLAAPSNPLQFTSALQMAALFQGVLFAVHVVRVIWGQAGVLVSGAVLGFTDVDALVISMARSAPGQVPVVVAAQAIAVGVLSNTVLKLALALAIGRDRFRRLGGIGLAATAIASVVAITLLGYGARI
jgi:uncharacterized membrane protein (DUF4010 family)